MMPKDIKEMTREELLMEYSFLWDMLCAKYPPGARDDNYENLKERMTYIVYELGLREIPLATYHYIVEDDRMYDENNWSVDWNKRTFKRIDGKGDCAPSEIISFETFKRNCISGVYDDDHFERKKIGALISYSRPKYHFRYAIKVNDYYIDVYSNTYNCVPTVDAVKKDCVRTDFQYIRVYKET